LLVGSVLLVTVGDRDKGAVGRLLLTLFWFVFCFFVLIRAGTPRRNNLDPSVWFWVDVTLLPAVLVAGRMLARLRGRWRLAGRSAFAAATAYAAAGVLLFHLWMSPIGM